MGIKSLMKLYQAKSPSARLYVEPDVPSVPAGEPHVVVNNSFSKLLEVPAEALEIVRETLTYKNEEVEQERINAFRLISMGKSRGNGKMIGMGKKKLQELEGKDWVCWLNDNEFPTGLLNIVIDVLNEKNFNVKVEDRRVVPRGGNKYRWKNLPPPLRYYQLEMVKLGLKHGRGVFESAVGTGKTRILTELIKILDVNSLIVVPSSALLEQTFETLKMAFGKNNVMILNTAYVKSGKAFKPIVISTVHTLVALNKKDLIEDAVKDFDLIAVDEIHHAGSKSYTDLLPHIEHIFYRFGFTGTFLRNDCKTLDMWGFLSIRLYSYPAWQATKENFLTPIDFEVHTLPGIYKRAYPTEYKLNYCQNEVLLDKIQEIVCSIDGDKQILILVDRKDTAGLVIHEFLEDQGISNVYISGDDTKEHIFKCITGFNAKKVKILVGSTVIGEGVDLYSTDHLILARGGKSEIAIVQAIGRAVRLAEGKTRAYVHDFHFEGTKFLEKHLKQRMQIYRNTFGVKLSALGD